MPSIADPRALGRYEASSDWYALAILLFSLFAGIHPFRGGLAGFGPKDMAERMLQGASMLRPGATWPASVPGPSALPKGLSAWLRATLEGSLREAPPARDWGKESSAPRKSARSKAGEDFPAPFERWLSPGLALLADGSAFDPESRESFAPPGPRAARWIDLGNGEAFWLWQDRATLRGASMAGSESFEAPLPAGAELLFWSGEPFALRPGAWSSYAVRRLGASPPKAIPCAQGPLGSSVDLLDGCAAMASFGAHALARPIGGGRGAAAMALKAPRPGSRLVFASCAGPYELVDWAVPGGSRQVGVSKKGAHVAELAGALDWACPLGEDCALAQADGKAWLISPRGASELSGWALSQAAPSAWRGSLWVGAPGEAELKSYPLSKLRALCAG